MLRITHERMNDSRETLKLEGRITGPWVAELQELCERLLHRGCAVTLDLSGVSFVERQGVRLLRRLRHRNVAMTGGGAFVTAQLEQTED